MKLQAIDSAGVVTPDKWAAQFISDLSLHIVNEDYEALEEIKRRSDEVDGIRATLLVNFGEDSKHNRYGIVLKNEGTTHSLLVKVLEHLTQVRHDGEEQFIPDGYHVVEDADGERLVKTEGFLIERIVDGKVSCYRVHHTGIDCFVEDLPTGGMRIFAFSDGWLRADGKAAHMDWTPPTTPE